MRDREHPFFRPLWRRIAVTVFCACWAAWEFSRGEELWTYITLGITAYAAWVFLITYDRHKPKPPERQSGEADAPSTDTTKE